MHPISFLISTKYSFCEPPESDEWLDNPCNGVRLDAKCQLCVGENSAGQRHQQQVLSSVNLTAKSCNNQTSVAKIAVMFGADTLVPPPASWLSSANGSAVCLARPVNDSSCGADKAKMRGDGTSRKKNAARSSSTHTEMARWKWRWGQLDQPGNQREDFNIDSDPKLKQIYNGACQGGGCSSSCCSLWEGADRRVVHWPSGKISSLTSDLLHCCLPNKLYQENCWFNHHQHVWHWLWSCQWLRTDWLCAVIAGYGVHPGVIDVPLRIGSVCTHKVRERNPPEGETIHGSLQCVSLWWLDACLSCCIQSSDVHHGWCLRGLVALFVMLNNEHQLCYGFISLWHWLQKLQYTLSHQPVVVLSGRCYCSLTVFYLCCGEWSSTC